MNNIVEIYTFEDILNNEHSFTTQDYKEAQSYAQANKCKMIINLYEFVDSELYGDYTKWITF